MSKHTMVPATANVSDSGGTSVTVTSPIVVATGARTLLALDVLSTTGPWGVHDCLTTGAASTHNSVYPFTSDGDVFKVGLVIMSQAPGTFKVTYR